MRCHITSFHLATFQHLYCFLRIRSLWETNVFPSKSTSVQVQKIVTVLHLKYPVESSGKLRVHHLNRIPYLFNGEVATLFFMMRSYNAIGTKITLIIDEVIHVDTLHPFVGQHPKEATDAARMFTHHFPVIPQTGTVTTVIQTVKEFRRHKDFGQTHVLLTLTVRTVVHGFKSAEITLRMYNRTLLRIVLVELTIQFGIPTFLVSVAPPDNRRMIHVTFHHALNQLHTGGRIVFAMPATQFTHHVKSQ